MIAEIVPDVYDLTLTEVNGGRYRAFCFDGDESVLVDTGLERTSDVVVDRLDELGVEPAHIVVTHGDPDHIGGLEYLAARYDSETWVPEQTSVEGEYEPDNRYGNGDTVTRFTAVHVPGHTADHHVLIDEAGGVAVLGDALFGADARGLPSGYFVLPTAFYSADLGAADTNLERLLDYEFDVGLVYHGSSVTRDASEKLTNFVQFAGRPE